MYAIVEIAGQQYKVEKGQQIYVHRLEQKEGSDVEFTDVLLIEKDGKVSVGKPTLEGAKISAKVLEHMKGDKVLVFKKKRRKGYQKLNGHRQLFSKLEIGDILEKGAKVEKKESKDAEKPKAEKAEKPKAEKPKAEAKKSSSGETAKPKAAKAEEKKESKAPAIKSTASKGVKKEETGKEKKTEPKAKAEAKPAEKKEEKPKTEKKAADKGDEKSES